MCNSIVKLKQAAFHLDLEFCHLLSLGRYQVSYDLRLPKHTICAFLYVFSSSVLGLLLTACHYDRLPLTSIMVMCRVPRTRTSLGDPSFTVAGL